MKKLIIYFDCDSLYFLKKPEFFLKFKGICALRGVMSPRCLNRYRLKFKENYLVF